jgi:hypothetical protein
MMMRNILVTKEVKFTYKPELDIEIEPFSKEEIESFSDDFKCKTLEKTKHMEKLLVNV